MTSGKVKAICAITKQIVDLEYAPGHYEPIDITLLPNDLIPVSGGFHYHGDCKHQEITIYQTSNWKDVVLAW